MSKIEISLDEYKFLKAENKSVYEENISLKKENVNLRQELENTLEIIDDVKESGLFERIFNWKGTYIILNDFSKLLSSKLKKE